MNDVILLDEKTFLPMLGSKVNKAAVARVVDGLPALTEQAFHFGRQNSQTTISLMTLTMMNGHSPMRMLRQILAEVDRRKNALSEAQIGHAKSEEQITELELLENPTQIETATLRHMLVKRKDGERHINGTFKDLAVLMDNYDRIKKQHNIEEWDEHTFELEEKRHHIRRAFELLYRTMIQQSTSTEGPTEYLLQYGVHPQTAIMECTGYINYSNQRLTEGEILTGKDCEDFLDAMSHKYVHCANEVTQRIFGEDDIISPEYMLRLEAAE